MIESIATKGGITEEVLSSLEENDFPDIFRKSINRGYAKIGKITEELRR